VVGAALGVPVAAAWAATSRRRRLWTAGGTAALVALTVIVNAGLSVLARGLYLLPEPGERRAFVALQYDVHDALGGSQPPYVSHVAGLGPAGPDGEVAIVGDCDALYRSDGERWSLLESRPGGTLRAVVEGSRRGLVAGGDGWRIDLVDEAGVRHFEYVGTGADGAPITIPGQPVEGNGPVRADITADPAVPTVVVRVDGSLALEAFLRRAGGPLEVADGWRSIAGEAELCAELLARGEH
jgi:hypothetical protein